MKSDEQLEFTDSLLKSSARCEVRVNVWEPSKELLDWLLKLQMFKIAIHNGDATILNLYDGLNEYLSPTEATVFLDKDGLTYLRRCKRTKHLYREWYKNHEVRGGEKINES